jgi:hypothetical protein
MTRGWLAIAVLCAAPAAFAQAPGQVAPMPPPASASAPDPVMANRWGVGLALGGIAIRAHDEPSSNGFSLAQLAVQLRATRHIELGLAIAVGGGQDAMTSGDVVSSGMLDLRYRFAPRSAWDGWLMAGIGVLTVAAPTVDPASRGASRGGGEIGVGVERRFGQLAVQAELSALGLSAPPPTAPSARPPPPGGSGGPGVITDSTAPASATQLTIGASFFF